MKGMEEQPENIKSPATICQHRGTKRQFHDVRKSIFQRLIKTKTNNQYINIKKRIFLKLRIECNMPQGKSFKAELLARLYKGSTGWGSRSEHSFLHKLFITTQLPCLNMFLHTFPFHPLGTHFPKKPHKALKPLFL